MHISTLSVVSAFALVLPAAPADAQKREAGKLLALGSVTRADLPATLRVGLMAYDFNASPDITVSFDAAWVGSAVAA